MNTNTRRSFIGSVIAAVAAFFGFKAKSAVSKGWIFKRTNKTNGVFDVHIRMQPTEDGGFRMLLTTMNGNGDYEQTALKGVQDMSWCPFPGGKGWRQMDNGMCVGHQLSRMLLTQAAIRAINDKYDVEMGVSPNPNEPHYVLGDPENSEGLPSEAPPWNPMKEEEYRASRGYPISEHKELHPWKTILDEDSATHFNEDGSVKETIPVILAAKNLDTGKIG